MKDNGNAHTTYFIQTFGCAMNIADTERFRTILTAIGLKEIDKRNKADIIIFNTCSVKQKAEDRVLGLGREIKKLREQRPHLITVLTGCMARRRFKDKINRNSKTEKSPEKVAAEIKRRAPWLDIIIETINFHNIDIELEKFRITPGKDNKKDKIFTENTKFLGIRRSADSKHSAGITISHGCDHMCTFCIVPFARGREICRDFNPIYNETKESIDLGAKNIVLLGQTVNRWINPKFTKEFRNGKFIQTKIPKINKNLMSATEINKQEPKDFIQLLQKIDQIEGDFWLTFISSHPNYFTKELIDYIAHSVKNDGHIRPYIHLALQSGNDGILKKMRRNHTIQEFTEKVTYIKKIIPNVAITTDIIVGFCGETEEQFQDTVNICKKLEFDQIYISEYSQREGTGSSFMKDNISHEVKEKRKDIINEILKITASKNNKQFLGKKIKVFIEKIRGEYIYGRTAQNKIVRIKKKQQTMPLSKFATVKIREITPWSMEGEPGEFAQSIDL